MEGASSTNWDEIKSLFLTKQKEMEEQSANVMQEIYEKLEREKVKHQELQKKYDDLFRDSTYNMNLIHERDEVLDKQQTFIVKLQNDIAAYQHDTSEKEAAIDKLQEDKRNMQAEMNDMELKHQEEILYRQSEYEKHLRELQSKSEMQVRYHEENLSLAKDEYKEKITDVESKHESIVESYKRDIDNKNDELKRLTLEKNELASKMDSQEAGQKMQDDRYNDLAMQKEKLKANMEDEIKSLKEVHREHATRISKNYDIRISDLNAKVNEYESVIAQLKSENKQKQYMTEDKILQAEKQLTELAVQHGEQIKSYEQTCNSQENKIKSMQLELDRASSKFNNSRIALRERDRTIDKLKEDIESYKRQEMTLQKQIVELECTHEREIDDERRQASQRADDIREAIQKEKKELQLALEQRDTQLESHRSQLKEAKDAIYRLEKRLKDSQMIAAQQQQQYQAKYVDKANAVYNRQQDKRSSNDYEDLDKELGLDQLAVPSPLSSLKDFDQLSLGLQSSHDDEKPPRGYPQQKQDDHVRELVHQFSTQLEESDKQFKIIEEELFKVKAENRKLKQQIEKQGGMPNDLSQAIKEIHSRVVSDLSSNSNPSNTTSSQLANDANALEKITELNSQLTSLRVDHERMKSKYLRATEQYAKLKGEKKTLIGKLQKAAKSMKKLIADRENLIDANNRYKSELASLAKLKGIPPHKKKAAPKHENEETDKVYGKELRRKQKEITRYQMLHEEQKRINRDLRKEIDRRQRQLSTDSSDSEDSDEEKDEHFEGIEGELAPSTKRPEKRNMSERETQSQRSKRISLERLKQDRRALRMSRFKPQK